MARTERGGALVGCILCLQRDGPITGGLGL